MPKTVQQLLPIYKISDDGICLLENKPEGAEVLFDKAYLFLDTNFVTMDDLEKDEFLRQYCTLLNSLNVSYKIILISNNQDMDQIQKDVFIRERDGQFSEMIDSFNKYISECVQNGHGGLAQTRIFVISVKKKDLRSARDYFKTIEVNLNANFTKMQSAVIPMDGTDRLKYLFSFWHLGEGKQLERTFDEMLRSAVDWKDAVAPQMVGYYQNEYGALDYFTLQINGRFSRVLYLNRMPSGINPESLGSLMEGNFQCSLTIDTAAIPQEVVRKHLNDVYMGIGRTIEKQQETRNRAGAWSSDVSYDIRRQKAEVEGIMDVLNDNNEKMTYTTVYAVINAPTRKELENNVTAFCSKADGEGFHFEPIYGEQIEAFNTAGPTGIRYSNEMIPLLTQPIAAFTPFIVQELYQPGGIAYGVNQISRNILIGDRKTLLNGNGFILGLSGSGKGMETKKEITEIFLTTDDDIIVIDPMNEYEAVCDYFHGQFIDFSPQSKHYINPLDTDTLQFLDSEQTFLKDKTTLMLSIFSQIKENTMTSEDNSLIGRVVTEVYEGIGEKGFRTPTLVEFYQTLKRQPEPRAQALALSMELFVTGAMNMFAKPTNVNTKNRFTVYGIADIDRNQSGIGIIIMLEAVRARIAENWKKGKCTWLFIDEFHHMSHNQYSALYLDKIWREVRKQGGLCTAITQNVGDLLTVPAVESMLCNSEFLMLLNLKENERHLLETELGISPNLMQYISNPDCGCGLLKFGNKVIPCDGRLPKDSAMYRLFNTNFHELAKIRKGKVKGEVKNPRFLYGQLSDDS